MKNAATPSLAGFLSTAIAAVALAMFAAPGHAASTEDAEMNARFDALDAVRGKAAAPVWPDLPKLALLNLPAPVDSSLYKQAFSMSDGCKFFSVNADGGLATGARWQGEPCKGGLISGKGSLAVAIQQRDANGAVTLVYKLYEGEFAAGFLQGTGLKQNYAYDASRQPRAEYYRQEGEFSYGLLEGAGRKFVVGKQGTALDATMQEGGFVEGTAVGHAFLVRSKPFAGALADQYELVYNKDGQTLRFPAYDNDNKPLPGRIRFAGKGGEWSVALTAFDKGQVEAGRIQKAVKVKGLADIYLAYCANWQIADSGAWQCSQGSYIESHPYGMTFSVEEAPFAFNPQSPREWVSDSSKPIRVGVGAAPTLNAESAMLCNADRTQCKGKATMPVSLCMSYRGPAELRQGKVTPVAGGPGEFYTACEPGKGAFKSRKDFSRLMATCESFDSPLRCGRGKILFNDGDEYAGPFVLDNVRVSTDIPGEVASYSMTSDYEVSINRDGWGRHTFSNRRWANIRSSGDEVVEVRECGAPDINVSYCTLDQGTVVFNYRR